MISNGPFPTLNPPEVPHMMENTRAQSGNPFHRTHSMDYYALQLPEPTRDVIAKDSDGTAGKLPLVYSGDYQLR